MQKNVGKQKTPLLRGLMYSIKEFYSIK